MTAEKVVGAKYVMVNNAGYLEGIYAVGTVITLINDDGTAMPLFRNAYGDRYFVRMRDVVQIVGEEPAETKEVPKLKFTELQKDTVYVESDGDYVMIASKPVAGKTLFVQRNAYAVPFIVDNYTDSVVHNNGYIQATEEVVEEFNELFKQYVLENQQHITEEELEGLEEGDKITIVDYLYKGEDFGVYCSHTMTEDVGKELTFSYHSNAGNAVAYGGNWNYSHDMIASVEKAVKQEKPKFDCPELVYGNIYTDNDGWTFRYTKTDNKKRGAEVTGGPNIDYDGDYHFSNEGFIHFYKWRKATAEEVAKLEAAEKEHGYVPPLVNKVGTVIEAGKYYKIKSSSTTEYICKVVEVYEGSFLKAGLLVELDGTPTDTNTPLATAIDSMYGAYAVPATEEQIALYEAVLALRTAQQTFEEATQAVKEAA